MKTFSYKITIDGQDFEALGLRGKLFSIKLFQDELKSDMVIVDIWNENLRLTDSNIFRERARLDVWLGAAKSFEYMGSYILQKPTYGFPAAEAPVLRLIGFGESVRLKEKGEKRRSFHSSLDSDIVSLVASEYGFLTDVEATAERRVQENQLDETDLSFLTRLAVRNGYLLYIEDKVLHFHPLRYEDPGIELAYGPGENELMDFWPAKSLVSSAGIFESTYLDNDTKSVRTVRSVDIPDAVMLQDIRRFPTYQGLKAVLAERPAKYVSLDGTGEGVSSHQKLVDRLQQKDSYILAGWGRSTGTPKLKARRVVNITGLGHLSGLYLLKSVAHSTEEDVGYVTAFFAVKSRYGLSRVVPMSAAGGAQAPLTRMSGQEIQPEVINEITL